MPTTNSRGGRSDDVEDDRMTDSDAFFSSPSPEESRSEYEASEGDVDDDSNEERHSTPVSHVATRRPARGGQSSVHRSRWAQTVRSSTVSTEVGIATEYPGPEAHNPEPGLVDGDPPAIQHHERPRQGCRVPKRFHQSPLPHSPPPFKDLTILEFYQVFPHDPAATLCLHHFIWLACAWFSRRRGDPELDIANLARQFPHSRVDHQLRYMRNDLVMAGIRQYDEWRQLPLEDLVEELKVEILTIEQRMRILRRNTIKRYGKAPSCCLNNGKALVCGFCTAMKYPKANLYDQMGALAGRATHGEIREDEEWLISRWPESTEDGPWLDAADAYGSVGGLHFLVDGCDNHVMIKFA
ncbi:hypothetical protein PT974_02942 [Cladobotryum mycophilum]|uniref:Uncharacterized protein n=1 Tax=Cladobotryum mycophilum TaxID=491253 RepID=A0ABR0T020_9HYPO